MLSIFRRKEKAMQAPTDRGGWFSIIRESFAGAWQQGVEVKHDTVLSYHAVFACITLIASDIAKLPLQFQKKTSSDIWQVVTDRNITPLLIKPNFIQNRIQFFENWLTSKLSTGNAYILKIRRPDGSIEQLRLLDPSRVQPLISDTGEVYYQLQSDNVTGLKDSVTVPASEIIHDRFNGYHPLVGISPIKACGLNAMLGHHIQNQNASFFKNGGRPGGLIQLPGSVNREKLQDIKDAWDSGYSGANSGRTAILADGAEYKPLAVTASDAQVVEQLRMTAEIVASTFHVPLYKIGMGATPSYNNVEALDQQYYSQCLQILIESIELCLKEGLSVADNANIQFDLNSLLRMDTGARYKAHSDAIGGGWLAPNEARQKENLPPVTGGDSPYLQQQNFSLAALGKRDSTDDPFNPAKPAEPAAPATPPAPADNPTPPDQAAKAHSETEAFIIQTVIKGMLS
ncbi:phage portal protein [Enterobacter huaxiensis]|uniref:phage portal protein n=1 Tax=Enterobacter huaxiensis TaxID=2494702 RepID=UPI002175A580|nr:phage portal protein [Enterobacter huaxiensis]MCS5452503.1 phage portal protein [Enterobacter huaxiensis]